MATKKSLADMLYYDGEREYDVRKGDVMYLDSTSLKRKNTLGGARRFFVILVVAVGIVIGGMFLNSTVIAPMLEAQNIQKATEENLKRAPAIETIPLLTDCINKSDDEIRDLFDYFNYSFYDMTEANGGTLTLFKLPADVSAEQGEALLVRGIDNLNSQQASQILQGSWSFSADRVGGTTMVTRYVDFSTGTPEKALQTALAKQGFDPESQVDAGIDDSGNTYIMGNIEYEGTPCTWRISALPLKEVYDISGLPEDAVYVGVRLTV